MNQKDYPPNLEVAASAGLQLITKSLRDGKAILETDQSSWDLITAYLIFNNFHIIALRGAGSVNGIDPDEANSAVDVLKDAIANSRESGQKVAILYDGDADSLEKPDIGYIMGRLLDLFGNDPGSTLFLAAQKQGWYFPAEAGGNITNAGDLQYVTYVFPNDAHPGDHNSFTQTAQLVATDQYEQWYIGASGDIATSQLADFNNKVPEDARRTAVILRASINHELDRVIQTKLEQATAEDNQPLVAKLQKQLAQRQQKFGAHWDNEGNSTIDDSDFPNLNIQRVT